ncbi:hypothetical protein [Burkholderia gladioli]|uniref:hypothetical protein n=1 Tax=Burkholderia gladioli TaxID=28095 RepID=UPI0016409030|nr:hypothetical protein [Burkholderia gladioli]
MGGSSKKSTVHEVALPPRRGSVEEDACFRKHKGASPRIHTSTQTQKRNRGCREKHEYGSLILSKSADADFRKDTNAEINIAN